MATGKRPLTDVELDAELKKAQMDLASIPHRHIRRLIRIFLAHKEDIKARLLAVPDQAVLTHYQGQAYMIDLMIASLQGVLDGNIVTRSAFEKGKSDGSTK